jgi:hypothetical protein
MAVNNNNMELKLTTPSTTTKPDIVSFFFLFQTFSRVLSMMTKSNLNSSLASSEFTKPDVAASYLLLQSI